MLNAMDNVAPAGQKALSLRPDCKRLQDTPLPGSAAVLDEAGKPSKAIDRQENQQRPAVLPIARSGSWTAVQRRMLEHGYCSHHINYLMQRFDYSICYKLASLDRRIHRKADHSLCTATDQCIAFNTDERNYKQKHTPQCAQSTCSEVFVPYDDLVRIIQTGGVPLVSIKESVEGHLSIRVHERNHFDAYVVISHVWADGLGNPHANSLPSCQLRQLRTLFAYKGSTDFEDGWIGFVGARENVGGIKNFWKWGSHEIFWMDTLCIPVRKEHLHLRTKCINAMASIYARARRVFVLDKELMATTFSEADNLYQIISSVWMCRSWTLQEATLPGQCVFQFADRIIDPLRRLWYEEPSVIDTIRQSSRTNEQQKVILADYVDIRINKHMEEFMTTRRTTFPIGSFSSKDQYMFTFISTWNQLAGRSTTKAEDLYVVLASCLDFRLKQFQNLDSAEERMRRMVLSFERLPIGLLFNSGPKSTGNNRWLPIRVGRDLLHMGSYMSLPNRRVSKHSDQSRRIKLEIMDDLQLYLLDRAIPFTDDFIFRTEDGEAYHSHSLNPPRLQLPRLQYLTSCVVFQSRASNAMPEEVILHGALFYVIKMHNPIRRRTGQTSVELEYVCPLRIVIQDQHCRASDQTTLSVHPARRLNPHHDKCHVWLKFDPMPDFKPLRRQGWQEFPTFIAIWSLCGLAMFALFTWFVFPTFPPGSPRSVILAATAFYIVLAPGMICFMGLVVLILLSPLFPCIWALMIPVNYIAFWGTYEDDTRLDRARAWAAHTGQTAFARFCAGLNRLRRRIQ